jgi:hypothetical protein
MNVLQIALAVAMVTSLYSLLFVDGSDLSYATFTTQLRY